MNIPQTRNPLYNYSINPLRNYSINPLRNYSINPLRNYSINPLRNYSINPLRNYSINPLRNYSINPNYNYNINPFYNFGLSPWKSLNIPGWYRFDNMGNVQGFTVNINDNAFVLEYDKNQNILSFWVKRGTGYSLFAWDTLEYTGYAESNSANGYNIYDINGTWLGYIVKNT